MTLADIAARGYVTEDWSRWQQGECGTYAVAMIQAFPHLHLGGIDFYNDENSGTDAPGHYVAHDGVYGYDSAGRHLLPYKGVCGYGRWLDWSDMPAMEMAHDHGICGCYEECGDINPDSLAAAIAHATKHNILPTPKEK